ncbi:hypothetical protein FRX31_033782 [Thalictrum thalictroides]|uniref:Uncharacterized protein n=1 Tax=Thalictrum thalictroides TaxID=46969 RepID=A0A7J6UVX8_THATH|nr:hypothetical protein FRX31_033782 [Thalictrum thalictroides]
MEGEDGSSSSGSTAAVDEDVIHTLIETLVEPLLPHKSSQVDLSDISLQKSIANQMHAVVLLYNYYHRKQFPELEFLDFESFCKVIVNAKPSLLVFLELMENCKGHGEYVNLSIVEKAIMDACNISIGLETLKDAPRLERWPISKVAIFLIDSLKENCSLHFGAKTEGVWSLIEKNDGETGDSESFGAKQKIQIKRSVKVPNFYETHLQQLAISVVKDKTGIDPIDLSILESHLTYSLSEAKTMARLFIMKYQSVNEDVFQVPIKAAIDSLQGPLVKKDFNSYMVADVVEYFHLLPYAVMITDWFARGMPEDYSVALQEGDITTNSSLRTDEPVTMVATEISETNSQPDMLGKGKRKRQRVSSKDLHIVSDDVPNVKDVGDKLTRSGGICNGGALVAGHDDQVGYSKRGVGVAIQVSSTKDATGLTLEEANNAKASYVPRLSDDTIVINSVGVPRYHADIYQRLVKKFGDLVPPASKETTLHDGLIFSVLNGLLEVVEATECVPYCSFDQKMMDSWKIKLGIFEAAGLKVQWFREFLDRVLKQVGGGSADHELEKRLAQIVANKQSHISKLQEELDAALEEKNELEVELANVRLRKRISVFD